MCDTLSDPEELVGGVSTVYLLTVRRPDGSDRVFGIYSTLEAADEGARRACWPRAYPRKALGWCWWGTGRAQRRANGPRGLALTVTRWVVLGSYLHPTRKEDR